METKRVSQALRWLVAVGCLLATCQSCTKQDLSPSSALQTGVDGNQGATALTSYCKQVCLVAGQHTYVGTVNVGKDGNDLLVTYNLTAGNVYLQEIHLDVFTTLEELDAAKKLSKGGAIPGQFAYKQSFTGALGLRRPRCGLKPPTCPVPSAFSLRCTRRFPLAKRPGVASATSRRKA